MRIVVASDHAGLPLKQHVVPLLKAMGHEVVDVGTHGPDAVDYPDYAARVAEAVSTGRAQRGILICCTGIGMAMAANKFPGVRACPCHDEMTARLSRQHNDANVLCLSADLLGERMLNRLTEIWLATDFEGGRHARRLEKIAELEAQWLKPARGV